MATVPLPGIGPTIRTEADVRASARSSARLTTWLTLMPGAGSNSYDVMTGPGLTWTMRPSTSKSWSFLRIVSAFSWSSSRVRLSSAAGGALSSPTGGGWDDSAPTPPQSKGSCPARPRPARRPRGERGSATAGGGRAPRRERPHERGGAPRAQEQRQEKTRVPERPEGGPAEPHADETHRALLLGGQPRRIERRERDQAKPGGRERDDALDLAPPAVTTSPAAPPGLLVGRDERGHHTSRMSGSTTGFRRNRALTKCRTAVRTRAATTSRSDAASVSSSASAARTTAFSSSSSGAFSLTYTKPREAISGPATTAPERSTVTATAIRPSSARSWRSRSTTAPVSPTDLPSTKMRPAGKRPATNPDVLLTPPPVPAPIT